MRLNVKNVAAGQICETNAANILVADEVDSRADHRLTRRGRDMTANSQRPGRRANINSRFPSTFRPEAAEILNGAAGEVVEIDKRRKEIAFVTLRLQPVRGRSKVGERIFAV